MNCQMLHLRIGSRNGSLSVLNIELIEQEIWSTCGRTKGNGSIQIEIYTLIYFGIRRLSMVEEKLLYEIRKNKDILDWLEKCKRNKLAFKNLLHGNIIVIEDDVVEEIKHIYQRNIKILESIDISPGS
nr:MAG TPA: hypothetical protein [Inoviridae sp.]